MHENVSSTRVANGISTSGQAPYAPLRAFAPFSSGGSLAANPRRQAHILVPDFPGKGSAMKKLWSAASSSRGLRVNALVGAVLLVAAGTVAGAQSETPAPVSAPVAGAVIASTAGGIVPPPGYVIGADDVLSVLFWRDKDLTTDVTVRPDGKITLPLMNDVQAAGLTPEQLRDNVTKSAAQYVQDPNVTVVVKAINSRRVYIQGGIAKPGPYPLMMPTTVMQLIATAGGVQEFAKSDEIVILRTVNGKAQAIKFNYKEVSKGQKLSQNIELQPGDTVVVR
jgi:polysaccharide export outer membrane protein